MIVMIVLIVLKNLPRTLRAIVVEPLADANLDSNALVHRVRLSGGWALSEKMKR